MKINKSSWHYRIVYRFVGLQSNISENLCTYFWQVVGVILFWLVFSIVAMFLSYLMFIAPLLFLLGFENQKDAFHAGLFFWCLVSFLVVTTYGQYLWSKRKPKNTEPSLVGGYVRAKKDKYCPLIEFTDA